jgi:glycerol uptake facilitator-like aquaporin
MKVLGTLLILVGASVAAQAAVPEIDATSAGSAITLVTGLALVIRGRRK